MYSLKFLLKHKLKKNISNVFQVQILRSLRLGRSSVSCPGDDPDSVSSGIDDVIGGRQTSHRKTELPLWRSDCNSSLLACHRRLKLEMFFLSLKFKVEMLFFNYNCSLKLKCFFFK